MVRKGIKRGAIDDKIDTSKKKKERERERRTKNKGMRNTMNMSYKGHL